jgi:hypothetical protein
MEELIFWLVIIVIVVGITIALIIYVILPLSIFLLVGIALAGTISGAGVALYNFGHVLVEAHKTVK